MKDRTIYLVDGTYNVYRAYHATPRLTTSRGQPTNAVLTFANMLRKLIVDREPRHLGVAFDTGAPTFRHEGFADYKAHRPPPPDDLVAQFPWVRRVCEVLRVPVIEKDGWEADDVIATLAEQAVQAGYEVMIVTSDKDMFQLVGEHVQILNAARDNLIMDAAKVEEMFGVRPSQVPDVLALWGDATDNIPGVSGIGEKGAKEIIKTFGSLKDAIHRADEIPRKVYRENLKAQSDRALQSLDLATIRRNAPVQLDLEALRSKEADRGAAYELFSQLEFNALRNQYAPRAEAVSARYDLVLDAGALAEALAAARAAGVLSIDVVGSSPAPMHAGIVGIAFTGATGRGWYVPVAHTYLGAPTQVALDEVLAQLRPLVEDAGLPKAGNDLKYETIVFERHGITLRGTAFDSTIASYLIDPGRRLHSLDVLALDYLDHRTLMYAEIAGAGRKEIPVSMVEVSAMGRYAGEGADVELRLRESLAPRLRHLHLNELNDDLEIPLLGVLARMEKAGVKVDCGILAAMSTDMAARMDIIEAEIYELAGCRFNIQSPRQLGDVLFEKLEMASRRRTLKTRALSTSQEVLEELAEHHPLPRRILDYRSLAKLKSTYVDALPLLVHPQTGRVHTSYNQTVAATGRLSSSDPNLQNIPVRTNEGKAIRRAFVPEPGHVFLAADYSQVELRVMAHMADIPELAEAFRRGEDIHERTAAEVFGVMPGLVTSPMRAQAKTINFGILYGMGPVSLAAQLGISRTEAQQFIERYFARFPRIKEYIDKTMAQAERDGYVTTLFHRRRYFPELKGADRMARQQALRAAVNTTIQGTAADLIKKAMLDLDRVLASEAARSRMILQVHDELVLECPEGEVERVGPMVKRSMEDVASLRAPLVVDVKVGRSWEDVT
ncbi:MAG: DNA polymerase I [Candidatus Polarisedimenticolia bacterium]